MKTLIRSFKRHYHKTRKVIPEITKNNGFTLNIVYKDEELTANSRTPGLEVSIQFAVLMRRFLYHNSDLYYENIVKLIKDTSLEILDEENKRLLQSSIDLMKQSSIGIQVNGKDYSAEDIYKLISEGEFFNNDKKTASFLRKQSIIPLLGPLFWHQFYSYTLDGFHLVSVLFELITKLERNMIKGGVLETDQPKERKCIYCLRSNKSFQSEEHIFPEALGNDEALLPQGFVCDECNNGVLSRLDQYLIKFEPIAFLQVQYVPYLKSGKLPKANFQNIMIERTHPRHVVFTIKDKTGNITNKKELGDGMYSYNINLRGKPLDPVRLGRSLYKIGLGFIALDQGHNTALGSKFDKARSYINGETNFSNYLLISTKVQPHPGLRVTHKETNPGNIFIVDIFGVIFIFNLEENPEIELIDPLLKMGFEKYYLK